MSVHFPCFLVLQTWIHMLVIIGSILSYFFFALVFGAMCVTCNPPSNPYWIMQECMLDPVFYLVCVLTTYVALLPRYGIRFIIKRVSEIIGLEFSKQILRMDGRTPCLAVEKSVCILVKILLLTVYQRTKVVYFSYFSHGKLYRVDGPQGWAALLLLFLLLFF